MYDRLIKAVQQRAPLQYTFKLIDECIEIDGQEVFLEKYISVRDFVRWQVFFTFYKVLQGKTFQGDAHGKIISYLERKGFSFPKNDPFLTLECEGQFGGDLHQHRFFELSSTQIIHIKSSGNMVSSGTTGFFLWEGSVAFLALLMEAEQFKAKFSGKRVLELGSGAGLAGISVAALAQPSAVLLTDVDRVLDAFSAPNCVLHSKLSTISTASLDWCDYDKLTKLKNEFDIVIGCDLVYDPDVCQLLLEACRLLLKGGQVQEIVFLCTLRNSETFENFVSELNTFARVTTSHLSLSASNPIIVTDPSSLRLLTIKVV